MESQHPHRRFSTSNKAEWPGNSPRISHRGPNRPRLKSGFPQTRLFPPDKLEKATVAVPIVQNPLPATRRIASAIWEAPEPLRAGALGGTCAEELQWIFKCSAHAHLTTEHPNIIVRNIMHWLGLLKNAFQQRNPIPRQHPRYNGAIPNGQAGGH